MISMTTQESNFLSLCSEISKKEKVKLITALRRMMDMDTEGTFYGVTDQLTSSGLLVNDFIRLLKERGEKK